MMRLRLIGAESLARAINDLGEEAAREIDAEAGRAAHDLKGAIRQHLTGGNPLNVRTNLLRNSIKVVGTSTGHEVGTNVVYGPIHEYGGTIVPKNARNLAIPIGDLQGSPTKHNLRFIIAKGKKFLIDANGRFQYVLKESVTMPKRPFMAPSLAERKDIILRRAQEMLQRLIDRAAGRQSAS